MNHGQTVLDFFHEAAEKLPHAMAFRYFGKKMSYGTANRLAERAAAGFRARGVRRGDRVAIVAPNTPTVALAVIAAWKIGLTVSVINFRETPKQVIAMLKLTDPRIIIVLENFVDHIKVITDDPDLGSVKRVRMTCGLDDYMPFPIRMGYCIKMRKTVMGAFPTSWREMMHITKKMYPAHREFTARDDHAKENEIALLQHTSGTTSESSLKAAALTHKNLASNALQALAHMNEREEVIGPNDVFLSVVPLFHVYGFSVCLSMAFAVGAEVAFVVPSQPGPLSQKQKAAMTEEEQKAFVQRERQRLFAESIMKAVKKYRPTILPATPTMYQLIADHCSHSMWWRGVHSLKWCFSGAGHLHSDIKNTFELMSGATILEGYGLTEVSPIVSVNPPHNPRSGSLGKVVPVTAISIVDEDGKEVPRGEEGELLVKGPQVMDGYWRNPDATLNAVDCQGWLRTGDIVRQDEDGFLWFLCRKKEMAKVSGENVHTQPIENAIGELRAVAEVAVIGLPDEKTGEKVVPCIVLHEGAALTLEEVQAQCRLKELKKLAVPEEMEIVKELPKNAVGKVLKRELVKRFVFASS